MGVGSCGMGGVSGMGCEEGGRSVVGSRLGSLVEVGCGRRVSSDGSESGEVRLVEE